ncbi:MULTISPECIES: bifunctional DNA primase/polymerase [Streptomycetaceae]|uniref:DNA primase/polymerase bifunctional N-terminal domain-containing protein n=1 Tax=Streptantibioticus cattleyicolor (strain ATCC 35852 / DSM 46488 / JCM 4925 / NBRC 14057 / NRRL 8057) TaxID=1003195 RepID=F8JRY1_STREN|nr:MULTISPECIES: bifunctional DNA primase/polymerase [Streptomycetaceae]AEW92891.1 hypothetical protein SCATT_05200 [Streptantibioticus cattleyicolor NRRL 8057 = DSM 46488]MYS57642.1 DNA primase [Streptomyces sp. SID5468]CCB73248.1 Bifunctional DNA primase/polymerase [Streptantibioticus cattleyicolor NRRL 8057 = DSM 46488]
MAPLHAAALTAATQGWPVFPLWPGTKRPAIRNWEQRATTDPDRIQKCWQAGPYNIGVATGPARLVVLDLDVPKDPDDAPAPAWRQRGITCGEDVLAVLAERHGQPYPADTYTVRTTRGGTHLYFEAPAGLELRNTAGRLGWKIDSRANGGYVVGPGSVINHSWYTIVHNTQPAPLPGWLAALLRPAAAPPQKRFFVPVMPGQHGAYLRQAVAAELERVTRSHPGNHNNSLYIAAVALGQLVAGGALRAADVTEWLATAAAQVGQGTREAHATIASGLRAGTKRPRTVAA